MARRKTSPRKVPRRTSDRVLDRIAKVAPKVRPLHALAVEYASACRSVYGLYLDCTFACHERAKRLKREAGKHGPNDYFEYRRARHRGKAMPMQGVKYAELISRNSIGGLNDLRLGNIVILFLYELWEGRFRDRFAKALGVPRGEIKVPIIGDLRHLRNAVVHNDGVLKEETIKGLMVVPIPMSEVGHHLNLSEEFVEGLVLRGVLHGVARWASAMALDAAPPKS